MKLPRKPPPFGDRLDERTGPEDAYRIFREVDRPTVDGKYIHPGESVTVESHRRTHGVVTQTARNDLLDLVDRGLMRMGKIGRAFQFRPVDDLEDRLRRPTGRG
jgi:hypothetical protein